MSEIDAGTLAAWRRHLGHGADPGPLRAQLGEGTLPAALHAVAQDNPDRLALTIDDVSRTHGELDAAAGRFAAFLRERGTKPGDAVLLCAPSSIALVEAYLGSLRAGATVVLSNPSYTEAELRHLAEDSGATVALAGGPPREAVASLARELPRLGAAIDLEQVDTAAYEPLALDDAGEPALLAYTSGTTGKPKAVPLTHGNVLSSIRGVMLAWRWSSDDVLVHALPLFHQHGLSGVHATLLAGSRAIVFSKFDPERLCAAVASNSASVLFAVPAIYERIAALEGLDPDTFRSLRLAVSGSAPLSPALAARITALLGDVPLERYGTTESGLNLSNLYEGPRRPGWVGLPLPGVEVAIVDDSGRAVEPGVTGEIVVRGPQVFAGYRGDPEATAESFHRGEWFRTGDIGYENPDDAFVSITGRSKELIITGGLNVYPREVELALEEADAVARAAVVGVPSERWGEEVVAAVVPAVGARVDSDALVAFAGERLAPYKRPKRIVVIDELPVNAMGKIVRSEVVKLVSA